MTSVDRTIALQSAAGHRPERRAARPAQRGFTLLEAIVALVIFSMAAVALYGWQNTNLQALERAQAHARGNAATRSALAVVAHVNPMLAPTGQIPLGDEAVRWTATALVPVRTGVTQIGTADLFDVGLYRMHVEVVAGGNVIAAFDVRQAGYKQVRKQNLPP